MSEQTEKTSLETRLMEKRNIEAMLQETRSALGRNDVLASTVSRLSIDAAEARTRLESFKIRHAGNQSKNIAREIQRMEQEVEDLQGKSKAARSKRDGLEQEEAELESRLASYSYLCSEDELSACMGRQQQIQAEIAEIKNAIQTQEEAISEAREAQPNIKVLETERQDILAGMEMGSDWQKALDQFDKGIEKARKDLAAGEALIKKAEATIAGLRRRLVAAEGQAKRAEEDTREAACHYLINRASIANEDYTRLVVELGNRFAQIRAMSELLRKISGGAFPAEIMAFRDHSLFVPAFTIGSPGSINMPEGLLNPERLDIEAAVQDERARLMSLGVMLG